MARPAPRFAAHLIVLALGLFASSCNAAGSDPDEAVECGSMRAFRVETGGCPTRVETPMRSCLPATGERHWGFSRMCASSPEGELYVVTVPHGADVVGDTGWSFIGADAGVSEACIVALQRRDDCDTDW
jgi:hypothetical protein